MKRKHSGSLELIAEAAGVSKMTVSRVLRSAPGFSESTRRKVMAEVERLGYLPNRLAAAFGTAAASTLVGVCVPRLSSHFFGQVLESIDRSFSRLGYQPMIGSHNQLPDQEEIWLRGLLSWRPAGVLLSTKHHSKATLELLRDAAIPIVEFWDLNTSPLDMSVGFNQFDSGYEMGRFAIAQGRRKPGLLGAVRDLQNRGPERFDGFSAAVSQAGAPLAAVEILNDLPGFYAGYYGAETLLSRAPHLDMIYFQDDTMALGGLAYCDRKGIRVPEDIGIAGWGGHEAASILSRRLTTTVIPTQQIGKLSAELLVGRLRGEPVHDVNVVPTRLVPGNTL
ncbi:MAG: LacI family DNA-binding transcriptional regulator [Hyphomicrobiales bacterium]|nr:LacI family DNA-binding transcriptional regulator [Hyphomicrobiales bacterium]MDE2113754.1 LacI family DNA-binding transcriptional regulator [Hyphomicrobiales bacterium]